MSRLHLAEANPKPEPGQGQMLEKVLAAFRAKQVLSSVDFDALAVELKAQAFSLSGVWNTRFADALYRSIEDSIGNGISASDWLTEASSLIKQYGGATALGIYAPDLTGDSMSSWYADLVFRQNTMNALNAARYAESFFGPSLESDPFWMFATAEDERVCEICAPLDGMVFSKIDAEGRKFLPSVHMNCFPAETRVVGAFERGFRAAYSGPVVVLETADGRRLTLTVNHPVLTKRGWVAAQLLKQDDEVFSQPSEVEGRQSPNRLLEAVSLIPRPDRDAVESPRVDIDHRPAAAEETFRSLGLMNAAERVGVRVNPVDFHGDAIRFDGEVDVVLTKRELVERRDAASRERFREIPFMDPDSRLPLVVRARHALLLGLGLLAPAGGFPRGLALAHGLGASPSGPFQRFGFGSSAYLPAGIPDGRCQNATRNPGPVLKAFQTLAGRVGRSHLGRHALGSASGTVPPVGLGGIAVAGGLATRLRRVETREFRGEVFDFQTAHGAILAEGIVISNCRCEAIDLDAAGVAAGGYSVSSGHGVGIVLPGDFNVDRLHSVPEELRRAA